MLPALNLKLSFEKAAQVLIESELLPLNMEFNVISRVPYLWLIYIWLNLIKQ